MKMKRLLSLSTLLLIFILPTSLASSCTAGGGDLIDRTCRNSSRDDPNVDYRFCVASLRAAPGASCAATLRGLGLISLRLVRDNVTATRFHIKGLLKSRRWDAYTRRCLADCLELYSDAAFSVSKAAEQLRRRRLDDANIQLSAAMTGFTTCEDGFKEERGAVSPLTKRNEDAFALSAVALSIMSMEHGFQAQ